MIRTLTSHIWLKIVAAIVVATLLGCSVFFLSARNKIYRESVANFSAELRQTSIMIEECGFDPAKVGHILGIMSRSHVS
ncbi:MAG: hypothetical protein AB7F75_12175, partial [Planctomycetota bacterium]